MKLKVGCGLLISVLMLNSVLMLKSGSERDIQERLGMVDKSGRGKLKC
jgi:hypothetical protein